MIEATSGMTLRVGTTVTRVPSRAEIDDAFRLAYRKAGLTRRSVALRPEPPLVDADQPLTVELSFGLPRATAARWLAESLGDRPITYAIHEALHEAELAWLDGSAVAYELLDRDGRVVAADAR